MQLCIKIFIIPYLYEAQHVSGDTPPIIKSLKLHSFRLLISSSSSARTAFHPDPARKLSAKLYDIYYCCVYSEKLLVMDRGTVQNM
jgi:hypothetical protein